MKNALMSCAAAAALAGCAGLPPLHRAVEAGDVDKVRELVDKGAAINQPAGQWNDTPLNLAAEKHRNDVLRALLEKGADVNAPEGRGKALHSAATYGNLEAVDILLRAGANVEARDKFDATPFLSGCAGGKSTVQILERLLEAGADPRARNGNGDNCVHMVVWSIYMLGGELERLKFALAQGVDPSAVDKDQDTPLMMAERYASKSTGEIAKRLEEAAAILRDPGRVDTESPKDKAAFEAVVAEYEGKPKPELPEEARKYRVQADFAVEQKRFDEAARLYGQALKLAPWWPAGYFNQALIYGELAQYPRAIRAMKRYLALAPEAEDARAAQDKVYQWESVAR